MRVGIDLDGVCYDFSASVRRFLCRTDAYAMRHPEPVRWEFYEDWGYSLDQFINTCHDGVDAGVIFTHGEPYPNTAEAFMRIKAAGHSIHIVTDRSFGSPGASASATLGWLAAHGLSYDSITFTADKTAANVDVMVDDKPANYEALRAAGVDAYLLTRAWNKHVPDAKRVLDLLHFAEVIA